MAGVTGGSDRREFLKLASIPFAGSALANSLLIHAAEANAIVEITSGKIRGASVETLSS